MSADRLASFQAAHDVEGYLIATLAPLPTDITVRVGDWAPDEPTIRIYAHQDVAALRTWQAVIGGEMAVRVHGTGKAGWTLAAVVDGIPVECWTLLDPPSDAEVELCGEWMDAHGDDLGAWPASVVDGYMVALARLQAGGAS